MKICPNCQRCYDDADATCAHDGAALLTFQHGSRIIGEKYRIDRRLGRGGMGAVYSGTHLELDRPVAIKLLLTDYLTDAHALERFRREARAAARLNHQNVADVYDYGVLPDGGAYIVMELIEGETLREHMNKGCPLPFAEAISIAAQVAEGIDAAHRNGVVHRDLKPSNIILARDHQNRIVAKVVDFGIAKLKEATVTGDGALTNTGMLIGTPRYMSPEQCAGHELDARSDIYTLGIILYEMLGCRPPFDAPSATAIAIKHMQEPPPSLANFRPDVPPSLARVVMQALEKDPDQRPPTAAEFARNLRDAEATTLAALSQTPADAPTLVDGTATLLAASPSQPTNHTREPSTDGPGAEPETNRSGAPTVEDSLDLDEIEEADASRSFAPEVNTRAVAAAPRNSRNAEAPPVKPYSSPAHFDRAPDASSSDAKRQNYLLGAGLLLALLFSSIALALYLRTPQADRESLAEDTSQTAASNLNSSRRPLPASDTSANPPTTAPQANANGATNATAQDAAALRSSLDAWLAAINSRDIDKQMTFYTSTTARYYTQQNAPQAFVRADKVRSLGSASAIEMRARDTQIEIAPNGRTATMRFTKQYAIERNGATARGEVLSELGWLKTEDGWKIISERDLRVIS